MISLPSIFKSIGNGILSKPGDKLTAEITSSGRQVVKIATSGIKRSVVRYPETGTTVETIVRKISE